MATEEDIIQEKLLEISIEQRELALKYEKDQLLLQRRRREAMEALDRLHKTSSKSFQNNRTSEAGKALTAVSAGVADPVWKATEDCTLSTRPIFREAQPFKVSTSSPAEENDTSIPQGYVSSVNSTHPNFKEGLEPPNFNERLQLLSAFIKPKQQSLIVRFRLPDPKTIGNDRHPPPPPRPSPPPPARMQMRTSTLTINRMKRPREESPIMSKSKRRTAKVIAQELTQEISELESTCGARPQANKRRRLAPGAYGWEEVSLDPDSRAELMRRLCNPIIQIFRIALRGMASATSSRKLLQGFAKLQTNLDKGSLSSEESLWEWTSEMEKIIAGSELRYGTNKEVFISKLQHWSDVVDECMHSCEYEFQYDADRSLTVDRALDSLKLEFASLAEDLIPIVKSDIA